MTSVTGHETIVVQFGILDWEAAEERFGQRPGADVYFDPKFPGRVVWYLTQGLYKMYYASVPDYQSQIAICDAVWNNQGNSSTGFKVEPRERSFSMGDIVILSNETVWLCISKGWICINPGVI